MDEMNRLNKDALERRKKAFRVRVNPSQDSELYPGAIDLEVTNTGSSWTVIRLMPDEVPKVIKALKGAIIPNTVLTNEQKNERIDALIAKSNTLAEFLQGMEEE